MWCLERFFEGKALKSFIKLFEVLQRSVEIKIEVNFYFNINFLNAQDGKGSDPYVDRRKSITHPQVIILKQLTLKCVFFFEKLLVFRQ